MSKRNLIKEVRVAAARHSDNPAVCSLIQKMDLVQLTANLSQKASDRIDELAGYAAANREEDGYYLFLNPPSNFMANSMKRAFQFHELAVTVDCLVAVLSALGEQL